MKLLILISIAFIMNQLSAQTLDVYIQNIHSNEGQLCIAIFNSEESFKKEKPVWEKYYLKNVLTDKTLKIKIQLMPGTYGLTLLDDINKDAKMNFNLIGIPLEGYGFGNYRHKSIFKPKFSAFSFQLEANQTKEINVTIQYF